MYYNSNISFLNANKSLQSSEVLCTETNFLETNAGVIIYGMSIPALQEVLFA